jgi:hypothetical protein
VTTHYVAAIEDDIGKVNPGPLQNPTGFSVLQQIDRLESTFNEAVICLTVASSRRDYSRYQGLQ